VGALGRGRDEDQVDAGIGDQVAIVEAGTIRGGLVHHFLQTVFADIADMQLAHLGMVAERVGANAADPAGADDADPDLGRTFCAFAASQFEDVHACTPYVSCCRTAYYSRPVLRQPLAAAGQDPTFPAAFAGALQVTE